MKKIYVYETTCYAQELVRTALELIADSKIRYQEYEFSVSHDKRRKEITFEFQGYIWMRVAHRLVRATVCLSDVSRDHFSEWRVSLIFVRMAWSIYHENRYIRAEYGSAAEKNGCVVWPSSLRFSDH